MSEHTTSERSGLDPWDALIERAQSDAEFRQALLAAPVETLLSAGIDVPEGGRVVFHEYDPNEQHLFLPPRDALLGLLPVTRYGTPKTTKGA